MLKNLPAMQETQIQFLHSTFLAWRIPWTGKPGSLQSMGHKESDMTERLL